MRSSQPLLFPDPRPLVERLGRGFFSQLPAQPGVYLMHDAAEAVIYVGKAKNLRQRLASYRVANPDRLRPRHLRLLRSVVHIELECCADEAAALARESELLRSLRPKYNRAGTWPGTPRFLVWRQDANALELKVVEAPPDGWAGFGPLGGGAAHLRRLLLRLLWSAVHPELGYSRMPAGWNHGQFENPTRLECGALASEVTRLLEGLLAGQVETFCGWLQARQPLDAHPFERTALADDIETIRETAQAKGLRH